MNFWAAQLACKAQAQTETQVKNWQTPPLQLFSCFHGLKHLTLLSMTLGGWVNYEVAIHGRFSLGRDCVICTPQCQGPHEYTTIIRMFILAAALFLYNQTVSKDGERPPGLQCVSSRYR